jgi:hypothetical protein
MKAEPHLESVPEVQEVFKLLQKSLAEAITPAIGAS